MATEGETKTYEIIFTDGRHQRITLPASYKVSFGAIVPAAKASAAGYGGWGLRVWEATDKQRAVYSGVVEFWDVSIPVEVKAARKYGTEEWLLDDGNFNDDEVERRWIAESEINVITSRTDDDNEPIGLTGRTRKARF